MAGTLNPADKCNWVPVGNRLSMPVVGAQCNRVSCALDYIDREHHE